MNFALYAWQEESPTKATVMAGYPDNSVLPAKVRVHPPVTAKCRVKGKQS